MMRFSKYVQTSAAFALLLAAQPVIIVASAQASARGAIDSADSHLRRAPKSKSLASGSAAAALKTSATAQPAVKAPRMTPPIVLPSARSQAPSSVRTRAAGSAALSKADSAPPPPPPLARRQSKSLTKHDIKPS